MQETVLGLSNGDIAEKKISTSLIITVDPSVTTVNADEGTILINQTTGRLWIKLDNGSSTNVKPLNITDIASTQGKSGWTDTSQVILSNNTSTNFRCTIYTATKIMYQGKEITLATGNYDLTISGAYGLKYLYFVNSTLTMGTSVTTFLASCPVATVLWDGSAIQNTGYELHSSDRNIPDHYWKHITQGMKYVNGLAITANVQSDNNTNPGVNTVQYFYLTAGQTLDEDIQVNIGTFPWQNIMLGSGLTNATAAALPFYFWNGTNVVRAPQMSDATPFISSPTTPFYSSTGVPHYENAGTLTATPNNNYAVYWVYASSLLGVDTCFIRPHNATFTSLNNALAASDDALVWTNFSSAEAKLLYRLVFRVNTAWQPTPVHGCKLVNISDYRKSSSTPIGGTNASDHASLINRGIANQHPATAITNTPAGNITSTDLQATVNELDTLKAGKTTTNTFTQVQTFSQVPIFTLGTNEVEPVNYIINSQMVISQRGNYTVSAAAVNNTYYADRFYVRLVTCTANRIMAPLAGGGNEYGANYLQILATNTATGTFEIGQAVETPIHLVGKTVTLSAWVASNDSNARLRLVHGTGGVLNAQSSPHSGSGAWERLSMTVTIPTGVTTTDHLYCKVSIYNAGNVSVATGKHITVSCMMLQEGQLTPYQPYGNFDTEYARCMRYFESNYLPGVIPADGTNIVKHPIGQAFGVNGVGFALFAVPKRIVPTSATFYTTINAAAGTWGWYGVNGSAFGNIAPAFSGATQHHFYTIITTASGVGYILGGWSVDVEITPA